MPGMDKNVKLSLVLPDNPTMEDVDAAEPQFTNAPLEPTGTDIDVLSSQTTVQLVWSGKTSIVLETDHQAAQPTVSLKMESVCLFLANAPLALPGTTLAATLLQTHAPPDLTTTV